MFSKLKFILLLFLSISNISAQDLYWAGFAFIGNYDQNFRYPVATQIFENDKLILSSTLKKTLPNIKREDINFIFEEGNIESGNAKALAFGLSDESL